MRPTFHHAERVVDAADYGASVDATPEQNREAFRMAVQAALQMGGAEVRLPAAEYAGDDEDGRA